MCPIIDLDQRINETNPLKIKQLKGKRNNLPLEGLEINFNRENIDHCKFQQQTEALKCCKKNKKKITVLYISSPFIDT